MKLNPYIIKAIKGISKGFMAYLVASKSGSHTFTMVVISPSKKRKEYLLSNWEAAKYAEFKSIQAIPVIDRSQLGNVHIVGRMTPHGLTRKP